MVTHPGEYRCSSFRQKTGDSASMWIDLDDCFVALGKTTNQRMKTYAKSVTEGVPARGEINLIRRALRSGQLTESDRFIDQVEKITGKRIERRRPGRPPTGRTK
jgi:putative transposase